VKLGTSNLVHRLIIASASPQLANSPWKCVVRLHLNFGAHHPYLWNGWS